MTRMLNAGAALLALSTAGCVDTLTARQGAGVTAAIPPAVSRAAAPAGAVAPNRSAATWQMPWQISPVGVAAAAQGEATAWTYVPQTGWVRGTSRTLASIGTPLAAAAGPNRTVQACRDVVRSEASKIGGKEVEAVSAGPHRRNAKGQFVAPVRMRITYATPGGFEVREATLTCVVDSRSKIVDAYA